MEEADIYFQDSLKRSPNNDKVLFDYANFIRDRGETKAALKLYRKAIVANPRHSLAHFNMGVLYIRTNQARKGRNLIEQAIRLNPDNSSFHENLGKLYLAFPGLGDFTSVLEDYVRRVPGSTECLSVLAEIHFKAHRFIEAADVADRAIALGGQHFGLLLTKANAAFSLRRLEDAEAAYRSALVNAPDSLDCMMNLASIAELRGDDALARAWYLRILDRHPGQDVALKRLAVNQTRNGLDAEVADVLDRACGADSIDPQSLVLVGSLFEKAGRIERASELYRTAATRKPEWADTMNRRAQQLLIGIKQRRNTHDSIGL
jgi:tetratricopeptide (TPR) repeat protein